MKINESICDGRGLHCRFGCEPTDRLAPLFFPENREIFQEKQGGDQARTGQSRRGIRDLDNFLPKQITGKNRETSLEIIGAHSGLRSAGRHRSPSAFSLASGARSTRATRQRGAVTGPRREGSPARPCGPTAASAPAIERVPGARGVRAGVRGCGIQRAGPSPEGRPAPGSRAGSGYSTKAYKLAQAGRTARRLSGRASAGAGMPRAAPHGPPTAHFPSHPLYPAQRSDPGIRPESGFGVHGAARGLGIRRSRCCCHLGFPGLGRPVPLFRMRNHASPLPCLGRPPVAPLGHASAARGGTSVAALPDLGPDAAWNDAAIRAWAS
jgi:hypothetical protein